MARYIIFCMGHISLYRNFRRKPFPRPMIKSRTRKQTEKNAIYFIKIKNEFPDVPFNEFVHIMSMRVFFMREITKVQCCFMNIFFIFFT